MLCYVQLRVSRRDTYELCADINKIDSFPTHKMEETFMGVHLLTFQVTDADGKTKSIVYPMADTESIADLQTFVTNHAALLDAIVDGVLTQASVQYALTLPGGLDATPEDDMLVSTGGLFGFSATGTAYRFGIYVPTVKNALISNSKDIPNAGDTAAWITDLLSGTEVTITNQYENVLAAFLSGLRVNRK